MRGANFKLPTTRGAFVFSLVMIALVVGALGGAAIGRARTARFRRRALIGWCCLPVAFASVFVAYLGLKSGEAFATLPLLWVGMLIGVPSGIFALGAGLGFWVGRRAQSGRDG
jgi:hypothetical protein